MSSSSKEGCCGAWRRWLYAAGRGSSGRSGLASGGASDASGRMGRFVMAPMKLVTERRRRVWKMTILVCQRCTDACVAVWVSVKDGATHWIQKWRMSPRSRKTRSTEMK